MAKMIGAQVSLGIAKEQNRGTAENTATFFIPKISLTLDDRVETVVDESSYGRIEDSACSGVLNKYGEGELEGKVDLPSLGLLLLSTMGTVTTTEEETGVHKHVFTLAQSVQHPSLTLFLHDKVQDYKYALAMLDSLSIKVEKGGYATINASFRAKAGETATVTPTYTDSFCGFLPKDFGLKLADTVSDLANNGTSYSVQSFEINFEKNLEDEQNLGSVTFTDINNKQFAVSGSLELIFDTPAQELKTLANNQTPKAMEMSLISDKTIGASSHPTLKVTLDAVRFTDPSKPYSNGDVVTMSLSFKSFLDTTNWNMATVEIINEVDNY